ncbi:MAG TPA: ABC transporter permease [Gaiellaceae bacterium]|nr:ABC transporter permease [Gaiellaceae bacterium]
MSVAGDTLRITLPRRRPTFAAAAGTFLVLVFAAAAVASPLLHHLAYDIDLIDRLKPPGTPGHLLGTDSLGRDVLARIATGVRISLVVSLAAVTIAMVTGVVVGTTSGFFGGWVDDVIMRITDAVLVIPIVLLAIAVLTVLGPSIVNLIGVIAFIQWTAYARTTRAETLALREQLYVTAAKSFGARPLLLLLRHILPHLAPSVIVLTTLNLSAAIILEASISFLGLGIPPPNPSLGSMLTDAEQYLGTASWLAVYPGLALLLLVLGVNLLGDALRQRLDPTLRSRGG